MAFRRNWVATSHKLPKSAGWVYTQNYKCGVLTHELRLDMIVMRHSMR